MASFFSDIWLSVFEPGTNKSLVIATHISFALLQVVLLALLVATESGHFVFLSLICGGLWAAITWFIKEVEAIKKAEALEKEKGGEGKKINDSEEVKKVK